jgi:hypothetical protein
LPVARGGSSSQSRAPNHKSSPSTRPRLREDTVLLTCGGENGRRKASNVEVAQAYCDGDDSGFRQCSSSENTFGSDGEGRGFSSKRWMGAGSIDAMAQRWW